MKKLILILLSLAMALTLCACGGSGTAVVDDTPADFTLEYAEGTELRIAAGYNDDKTAISFKNADVVGDGVTLVDGVTYHTGDLKPTWVYVSEKLGITFDDKFSGAGSSSKEWAVWENQLDQVDIIVGTTELLNAAGAEGKLINLADYIDQMPNFKAYLEDNQIARLSITGNTETGAIYFSPYFDGVDDIERMPLIRADLVRTLLDGDTAYAGANRALAAYAYEPYMPTTGKVEIESLTADGTGTQTITKDYDATQNIIAQMNAAEGLTGDAAVQMFRDYIDSMYPDYANRSDLFLGYDACWDADEMVALLRCAVASLDNNNGDPIVGLFSRETSNLQREIDLVRFAGSLFGARGMESRCDYLYFDNTGKLQDARQDEVAYLAVERLHDLVSEGLLCVGGSQNSANYLELDAGLMSYDYNQTQTVMNDTKLQDGEEYLAIMVPVAYWEDGTTGTYMRFTESWRSVKVDGWAISAAGVADSTDKLNAALALIDFAFSVQGQITMSYGPDAFINVKDETVEVKTWDDVAAKYETFTFNGKQWPTMKQETFDEMIELENGNYTNFARRYLGSTLNGFPKSQAFEYQATNEVGKKGAAVLSAAISAGVIKHPLLTVNESNMWYTSVPTVLPTTAEQTNTLKGYTDLSSNFQSSKDGVSVFYNIIKEGYTLTGVEATAKAYANYVANDWNGAAYLMIKNAQWTALKAYYDTIK
ncbi:MAG: hypothetical protein Q4D13_01265 [Erysipelotrichaceae bacterium]|nr:hypothetical protein [Erysipelotrichaceae bacterium]